MSPTWQTSRFQIDLAKPRVMGIVNLTPDSFSDGGQALAPGDALRRCETLLRDGADLLDLGAESTRPGAVALPVADELARLLPVLREAAGLGVPISVDTYKPQVMQAALDLGADIVNDVWGLRQPGAESVVAAHAACGVCLMHMHREPQTMQSEPMAGDVVPQVVTFLKQRVAVLRAQGVAANRLVVDPGIGFGKAVEQNLALLDRQSALAETGCAVLAGWSRKSTLGAVTGLDVADRLVPSVVAAVLAVQRGARVVRVHDVRETVAALKLLQALTDPSAGL